MLLAIAQEVVQDVDHASRERRPRVRLADGVDGVVLRAYGDVGEADDFAALRRGEQTLELGYGLR